MLNILDLFPHASKSFRQLNPDFANPRTAAFLERNPKPRGKKPLRPAGIQTQGLENVHVRIISRRRRLLDEDNLCEKFLVDCLRYCGAIRNDDPRAAKITTTQEKVARGEPEETLVIIEPLK